MQEQDVIVDLEIEPRRVPTMHGWQWIVQAFALFRLNPLIWLGLTALFIVIMLGISLLPLIGGFASTLLGPVLLGGLMIAAHNGAHGIAPQINDLFAGFKFRSFELVKVGAYYMLGTVLLLFVFSGLLGLLQWMGLIDVLPDTLESLEQIEHLWPLGLLMLACFALVYSTYFFAPALVVLNEMNAADAMKMSFLAFWRNWSPILLMSLLGSLLLIVLMLPAFLGLLVGLPVVLITSYVCYADIFADGQGELS
ncbi:BPSS1780 family membrane protein [Chitinibacter sp. S2-10]|uniref:BPSS1780 family membrane protein n=1 Tax=Chitinibacter sp. S2-10 TaxID=3373597 RepID=UPI0039778BA1